MLWYKVPPKVYFKRGALDLALRILKGKKRAFIVTDTFLFNSGAVDKVTKILSEIDIEYQIFFDIKPNPTLEVVKQAMGQLIPYEPDVIIALGGGSPMDAAKIMWLLYEQPETKFEDIAMNSLDIKNHASRIPNLGQKAVMVCIPTTSGTGSEVMPFAVIKDSKKGIKYAIADYALTPDIAIIDPNFVDKMPKGLTAATGIDALVHSIEAYESCISTNFTNSNALEATKLIFRYLERSFNNGADDPIAREKMHYASTIAGMSYSNSFFGLCHLLAHNLEAMYEVLHGVANALLIRQIIKYNSSTPPKEMCDLQSKVTDSKTKYAQIADELKLGGINEDEKVKLLIDEIDRLMTSINLPKSLKEYGVKEKTYLDNLENLVDLAFNNQYPNNNPYYLNKETIKSLYLDAYYGNV